MFNLEINFLKDRILKKDDSQTAPLTGKKAGFKLSEQLPLGVGIGVAALSLLGAIGVSGFLNGQVEQTKKHIQELDQQLGTFQSDKAKLATIQQELAQIKDETKAVVNVFAQVQPISAILQDLGDQMPRGVSIDTIEQVNIPGSPQTGGATGTQINLSGVAEDMDAVNDFFLTLQKSTFFNPEKTKINKAELVDLQFDFSKPKDLPSSVSWTQDKNTLTVKTPQQVETIKLPEKQVKYNITTELNPVSSDKLIQALQEKGASGLVTRLKTLKKEGLIQP